MIRMEFDLVISGAGPAGLAAAIRAGQLGLRCAVLERKAEGCYKVCGDGLTVHAVSALGRLGISRDDLLQAGGHEISSSIHYRPNGSLRLSHKPGEMYTLSRPQLLSLLGEKARSCGVSFFYGFQEAVQTGGGSVSAGEIHGRGLINATGSDRHLRQSLPFGLSGLIQAESRAVSEAETCFIHCLGEKYGYCWLFPLGNHRWNIGIWQTENIRLIRKNFDLFFSGWFRDRFSDYRWLVPLRGAFLGTGRTSVPSEEHVMFCGDAAGACSIRNGEGVSSALDSGMLAAEMLASRLSLCSRETAAEVSLIQKACPERIDALIPVYSGISMAKKYRIRTAAGDFYVRCDAYTRPEKIRILKNLISIPRIILPDWFASDSGHHITVSGYTWVEGQKLDEVTDSRVIVRAASGVALLLRQLHAVDVSHYARLAFDYEADYHENCRYLTSFQAEFPHFAEICRFVEGNLNLTRTRPVALTHQDVRMPNILIDRAGEACLIDASGASISDPWSDFSRIAVMNGPETDASFSECLIRSYFDDCIPPDFERVIALHCCFILFKYACEKHRRKKAVVHLQAERVYQYLLCHSLL